MLNYLLAMAPPPDQQGGGGGFMSMIIMMGSIFLIFYFLIIRPQQKRQKEKDKMLKALQKGDKIITSSGIHGVIAGVDDNTVLVQVADGVKIKFDVSAITVVTAQKNQPAQNQEAAKS